MVLVYPGGCSLGYSMYLQHMRRTAQEENGSRGERQCFQRACCEPFSPQQEKGNDFPLHGTTGHSYSGRHPLRCRCHGMQPLLALVGRLLRSC